MYYEYEDEECHVLECAKKILKHCQKLVDWLEEHEEEDEEIETRHHRHSRY
jgi:hypothetical protein